MIINTLEKKYTRRQLIKAGLIGGGVFMTAELLGKSPLGRIVPWGGDSDLEPTPVRQIPEPRSWSDQDLTVTWLGHASFLMNFFGTRILLDPALGDRIGITPFGDTTIGVKRVISPALTSNQVGPVDLLLLSHAHTDHFDYPTLRALQSKDTYAVTAKNTIRLWQDLNYSSITQIHWQDTHDISGVKVSALEGKHWGARLPWNQEMEANSFLLSKNGVNIFFSGDTGYTTKIKEQLSGIPIDLAIIGIAAYSPKSFEEKHATPEQAWQITEEIGAKWIIPMHWGSFKLSQEPMEEPLQRFLKAAGEKKHKIAIQEVGATWKLKNELSIYQNYENSKYI